MKLQTLCVHSYLVVFLVVAGCDRGAGLVAEETALTDPHAARVQSYLAMKSDLDVVTYDELLADIAVEVPGFGGFYVDEAGALNVWLVDAAQRVQAETVLGARFEEGKIGFGLGEKLSQMVVRNGSYDFLELYAWRSQVRQMIGTITGATSLSIDEVQNVIRIGASNLVVGDQIIERIRELGIPDDAFRIIEQVNELGITKKRTTLAAGLQIQFLAPSWPSFPTPSTCTLGPVARRNGVPGFITAAHCTEFRYVNTGERHYQATPGDRIIMTETVDPTYKTTGCAPGHNKCVDADAIFSKWDFAGTWNLGRIYETQFRSAGSHGSTVRVGTNLVIVSDNVWPYPGQIMDKVGRTTGWTYGFVTETCVDWKVPQHESSPLQDVWVECAIENIFSALGGDSGAPVFHCHTNGCTAPKNVTLMGVYFGSATYPTGAVRNYYSHTNMVKSHLGGTIQFY